MTGWAGACSMWATLAPPGSLPRGVSPRCTATSVASTAALVILGGADAARSCVCHEVELRRRRRRR